MNTDLTSMEPILNSDDSSDDEKVFHLKSDFFNVFPVKNGQCVYPVKERNSHSLPNPKTSSSKSEDQFGFQFDKCVHHSSHQSSLQSQECQIIYLMTELEAAKKSNKKLKSVIKSLTTELNDLKCTSRHVISNHYPPGVLTAMVSEVYKAQQTRDVAMMTRVRQANDERDDALLQLDDLKEKMKANAISNICSESWNLVCQDKNHDSLCDSDFLLCNQTSLLNDVALSKRKLQNPNFDDSPTENSLTGDTVNANTEDSENSKNNEIKISHLGLKVLNKSTQTALILTKDAEQQLQIIQQRLQEEIIAKEKAHASCLRLERLVAVLRKKINGFAVQPEESDCNGKMTQA